MDAKLFEFEGQTYPSFITNGNAQQYVAAIAKQFCTGIGLDVCAGPWPLPGARPIDLARGDDAMALPAGTWDYVFSSHGLEHLVNPVAALEHWKTRISSGGVLFLYVPHPDAAMWRPQHNREHLHLFYPADVAQLLRDLGFVDVLHSERDLAYGFSVVGFVKETP